MDKVIDKVQPSFSSSGTSPPSPICRDVSTIWLSPAKRGKYTRYTHRNFPDFQLALIPIVCYVIIQGE